jgi:hypothetical protein
MGLEAIVALRLLGWPLVALSRYISAAALGVWRIRRLLESLTRLGLLHRSATLGWRRRASNVVSVAMRICRQTL